jgi:hypothetical protein
MRRILLGVCILILLLVGCVLIREAMDTIHDPIALHLEQATRAALAENWATAQDFLARATSRWEHFHRITAAFADHTPLDEADGLFRQLQFYARAQENPQFSALCARLQEIVRAIRDNHQLNWQNLL